MTPQDDYSLATGAASLSTASRGSVAPNAPRKAMLKPPQYACDESQMTDDIEDTFQEAPITPATSKVAPAGYHQPALQLAHASAKRTEQGTGGRAGKEVCANPENMYSYLVHLL
jgi:hypothetical protein